MTIPGWMDYEAEKADLNLSRVLQEALVGILGLKKIKKFQNGMISHAYLWYYSSVIS